MAAGNSRAGSGSTRNRSGRTCICIRCFDDLFSYFLRFRGSPEEIEQRHKSKQIDKTLRKEDRVRKKQVVVVFFICINIVYKSRQRLLLVFCQPLRNNTAV